MLKPSQYQGSYLMSTEGNDIAGNSKAGNVTIYFYIQPKILYERPRMNNTVY